jgi:hypothetical protein
MLISPPRRSSRRSGATASSATAPADGTLAIVIGVLWYTSALWYYEGFRLPAF